MSAKTEKAIRAIIEESIAREAEMIAVHDAIARIIAEKFEGKQVTKRIATLLRERMSWPETCVVSWDVQYGSGKIRVWGKGTPFETFDCSGDFYIGSSGYFGGTNHLAEMSREEFEKCDNANGGAAKARNARRSALLANGKALANLADELDAYVAAANRFNATIGAWKEDTRVFDDNYTIEVLATNAIKAAK